MPEVEKQEVEKKDEKMVPLDTSGPGAEVDLPDDTVKSEEAPKEAEKTEQKEEPIKVEEVKTEEVPAK